MAENKQDKKQEKKEPKVQKKRPQQEENYETLVRILSYDIPGSRKVIVGLTRIKGISWAMANAICTKLGISKDKKFSELSKDEISKIEKFIENVDVYDFLKNRRSDPLTGEASHLHGTNLEMKKEFDVKRLKEIKSYRGTRHASKLPSRGQRTRSHFRKGGKAMGVKKKAK